MNDADKLHEELEAIEAQESMLVSRLEMIRDYIPDTPLDAAKKAEDIGMIEEQLGELITRRRQIAAILDSPLQEPARKVPETRPALSSDEATEQIKSISDELMGIEIAMLKAEMAGDETERQRLEMNASVLKARRSDLIALVRESGSKQQEATDIEARVSRLEEENRRLSAEIQELKKGVSEIFRALSVR